MNPQTEHMTNKFILELMNNCEVINQAELTDQKKVDNFKTLWKQFDGWSVKG